MNWRLPKKIVSLLLIIIFLFGFSYQITSGMSIYYHYSSLQVAMYQDVSHKLRINVYSGGSSLLPEYGQNLDLAKVNSIILEKADELSLPLNDCNEIFEIDILYLPKKDLNNRIKVLNLYPDNYEGYGLFDPLINYSENAKLLIASDLPIKVYNEILIHELTHYWYDRLCWNEHWLHDEEKLAKDFEKYNGDIK